MKRNVKTWICSLVVLLSIGACNPIKLIDKSFGEYYYHYYVDTRENERGIKYILNLEGFMVDNIEPTHLVVNGKKLPVEKVLSVPSSTTDPLTLVLKAVYREKKKKGEEEFPEVPDGLYGAQPFENVILHYTYKGKPVEKVFEYFPRRDKID